MIQSSEALSVALWPGQTYAALVRQDRGGSLRRAAAVPLLTALVIGTSTSIALTGVASLLSIASAAACWSFVPAIQIANGLLLCRRPPDRRLDRMKAIELLFLAHVTWSVWLIAVPLALLWSPAASANVYPMLLTGVVPFIWTAVLVVSFCRTVLGCTARQAAWRTLIYLGVTLTVIFFYIAWAVALWPRILQSLP